MVRKRTQKLNLKEEFNEDYDDSTIFGLGSDSILEAKRLKLDDFSMPELSDASSLLSNLT